MLGAFLGSLGEALVSLVNPVSIACLVGFNLYGRYFLKYIENREDTVRFTDPVLKRFKPRDYTVANAILFNTSVVCICLETISNGTFRDVLHTHALTMLVRVFTLYLLPLSPPLHSIPLRDPIIDWFTKPDVPLMKDLFVSGHTLFVWVNLFSTQEIYMHSVFAFIVPLLLIGQHVHYTIDVLVSPFVAWACYSVVQASSGC